MGYWTVEPPTIWQAITSGEKDASPQAYLIREGGSTSQSVAMIPTTKNRLCLSRFRFGDLWFFPMAAKDTACLIPTLHRHAYEEAVHGMSPDTELILSSWAVHPGPFILGRLSSSWRQGFVQIPKTEPVRTVICQQHGPNCQGFGWVGVSKNGGPENGPQYIMTSLWGLRKRASIIWKPRVVKTSRMGGFSDNVLSQFTKMAATSLSSNTLGTLCSNGEVESGVP